jgi:NYN domain
VQERSLCVYVDVENVRKRSSELLRMSDHRSFIVDPESLRLELARLAEVLPGQQSRGWSGAKIILFTGTPPKDHASWVWYQPLHDIWVAMEGVDVREWPVSIHVDKRTHKEVWKQDSVDVLLSVAAVQDAWERRYEAIIIVSGDGDVGPAVQACVNRLGAANVLTAAVEGSYLTRRPPPSIRLDAASTRKLDLRSRLDKVAIHYADLFAIEDESGATQARKFVEYLAAGAAPLAARRALTRAYLDAFWWWGNYEQFKLCGFLISNWGEYLKRLKPAQRAEQTPFLEALRKFDECYPAGTDDQKIAAEGARWEKVGDAAEKVSGLLELGGELSEPAERHLAALLEIYLAESHRFRAGSDHYNHASGHYRRAAELLAKNNERWNLAWVRCDWAALEYAHGKMREARRRCDAAEDGARALGAEPGEYLDHELLAKIALIRAVSLLSSTDSRAADHEAGWDHAAAALRHASAFQVRPASHPDSYTQEFIADIRAKVAQRILLSDPDQRERGLKAVIKGWQGLWPDGCDDMDLTSLAVTATATSDVEHLLCPEPPTDEELEGAAKTSFIERLTPLIDLIDEAGALKRPADR